MGTGIDIQAFVKSQSKLVQKRATQRVAKVDLTNKNLRGSVALHFVPDEDGLPMLTAKGVMEVHQTEHYTYQDEERVRYPVYIIPSSVNYNNVKGAVKPTEMQLKKLDKLYNLLSEYRDLANIYQEGGPKIKSEDTETNLWVKSIGTYTKFWAKICAINPAVPNEKAKPIDTSKVIMCTHGSANFVKAFNNWGSVDEDSEVSVEDQLARIEAAFSNEPTEAASCVKITTTKSTGVGFDVEMKNTKLEKFSVEITEDDVKEATSLIKEDWDYTNFDDQKVDTLIERVEAALELYDGSDEDAEDEDEEGAEEESEDDEDEEKEESPKSKKPAKKNPFDDDEDSDDE